MENGNLKMENDNANLKNQKMQNDFGEEKTKHITVLLNEAIEYLDPQPGEIILDGTFGGGGHTKAICERIGEKGTVFGIDQDAEMIKRGEERIKKGEFGKCKVVLINGNFGDLDKLLREKAVPRGGDLQGDGRGVALKSKNEIKLDGALFDLGFNSMQLEESGRGFSFQKDEPLIMTYDSSCFNSSPPSHLYPEGSDADSGFKELKQDSSCLTAEQIVNEWDEKDIANVLYGYGQEKFSRRIAKGIVERRQEKPIKTTFDLVDVIRVNVPAFYRNNRKTNCCTKTFQALRIAVNSEFRVLEEGLEKAWNLLNDGGRLVVISFHSLEDKIVKDFFRKKKNEGVAELLLKKPLVPSEEEVKGNPRARSAKLRAIRKTQN